MEGKVIILLSLPTPTALCFQRLIGKCPVLGESSLCDNYGVL